MAGKSRQTQGWREYLSRPCIVMRWGNQGDWRWPSIRAGSSKPPGLHVSHRQMQMNESTKVQITWGSTSDTWWWTHQSVSRSIMYQSSFSRRVHIIYIY